MTLLTHNFIVISCFLNVFITFLLRQKPCHVMILVMFYVCVNFVVFPFSTFKQIHTHTSNRTAIHVRTNTLLPLFLCLSLCIKTHRNVATLAIFSDRILLHRFFFLEYNTYVRAYLCMCFGIFWLCYLCFIQAIEI